MRKEIDLEFIKFFIRVAEITFAVMIATPIAAFVLGQGVSRWQVAGVVALGMLTCLIFLGIAFIIRGRWKR